jgi:hypothetical protein
MLGEVRAVGEMESRGITCSCTGVLCRITLYVLFRRYITAVLFSAYSRMGSVLPCVIRCEITAVITAYTLLTTLVRFKGEKCLYFPSSSCSCYIYHNIFTL